ncbi:MAG: ATP-binding cassette domain-containing protein [Anaerolineae bacterium]|nr:ATP-binding cassette domain-containing protein [Anaerolineae bacterium]
MIHCEGLVKIYRVAGREVTALQGLELRVAQGEILGIVGPSGAGKSTLLNVLGGLDRPSAGEAWVNGRNLAALSDGALDRYRRDEVGFIWQQPGRNLLGYLTALENVMLPLRLARVPRREQQERAARWLDEVGLAHRCRHLPVQLSGGEQQRAALAVALANQPKLLLADEPTGELDTATAGDIYRLLRDRAQQHGVTILIVSHDTAIAHHVDRVVSIRDGKTSTETVKTAPADAPSPIANAEPQFAEYVVVDSAGRLQIPQDLREDYAIRGRIRLEKHPDGILIRPEPLTGEME